MDMIQCAKEKNRIKISNSALKLFANSGFVKTTVNKIALEAQISSGALYLYYKSKYDLYALPSVKILKRLAQRINEIANLAITEEAKIDLVRDTFVEIYNYDSYALSNLVHLLSNDLLGNLSKETVLQIKESSDLIQNVITQVIKEGIEHGGFIDEEPAILSNLIWASFIGVVFRVTSKKLLPMHKESFKHSLNMTFKIITCGMKLK